MTGFMAEDSDKGGIKICSQETRVLAGSKELRHRKQAAATAKSKSKPIFYDSLEYLSQAAQSCPIAWQAAGTDLRLASHKFQTYFCAYFCALVEGMPVCPELCNA